MREYYVRFSRYYGEESLIVLPSFWKLLIWFIRTGRKCSHIVIFVEPDPGQPASEDPCNTCLRWDECNGVDREDCPLYGIGSDPDYYI